MSGEGGNGTISTTGTGDEGLLMSVIEHIPWYRDVEIILMARYVCRHRSLPEFC